MEALDEASKHRLAVEMVTGGDPSATCEALGDFVQCMSTEPQQVKRRISSIKYPISDYKLIALMCDNSTGDWTRLESTMEFFRRYLDSDGTKAIIKRLCEEMGK